VAQDYYSNEIELELRIGQNYFILRLTLKKDGVVFIGASNLLYLYYKYHNVCSLISF